MKGNILRIAQRIEELEGNAYRVDDMVRATVIV